MTTDDVLVERTCGRMIITLNRPEVANALNPASVDTILATFADAVDVRGCVIKGNGHNFCGGFDLSDLDTVSDGDLLLRLVRIEMMLQCIHHAPFPVMALAHGNIVGAGADLFAACSRRVAAPDSKFSMPGWNFEIALGTRRLTRLIGADATRAMLIGSCVLSATRAAQIGLASCIAPHQAWDVEVEDFWTHSSRLSPTAVATILKLTGSDSRQADLAALVETAGRPGLKKRIVSYRDRLATKRAAKRQSQPASAIIANRPMEG